MNPETISAAHAAGLVKSGMWLDYGFTLCQPHVFDQALAARKHELENVKIRSTLSVRPHAVVEADQEGAHFHMFNWHFPATTAKSTMLVSATTYLSTSEKCPTTTADFLTP